MGRLLNPGLGELADRYTILQLKIEHAPDRRNTAHFHTEQAQVLMHMERHGADVLNTPKVRTALGRLSGVNGQLWDYEDRMARYATVDHLRHDDPHQVANVAVEIWRLNRQRNELIAEINTLAGTDRGPEKL